MVSIDVGGVADERMLHLLLKRELGFPDFYGMNWDAFWDSIAGLVQIPDHLRFLGWDHLVVAVPRGATKLREALDRYRDTYRPQFAATYGQE
ncbi:barstar family protein [Streptomyces sp. NPDC002740]